MGIIQEEIRESNDFESDILTYFSRKPERLPISPDSPPDECSKTTLVGEKLF